MSLRESATKSREWKVWTGSVKEFGRILSVIEDQFTPVLPAYVEAMTATPLEDVRKAKVELEKWTDDRRAKDPEWAARWEPFDRRNYDRAVQALDKARVQAEGAARIGLTLKYSADDKREVVGTAAELTEYLEDKKVLSLEFEAPVGRLLGGRITLDAGSEGLGVEGVRLQVSSSDSRWASGAYAECVDEIRKGAPGWRWIRTLWFLIPFYLVSFGVAGSTIVNALAPSLSRQGQSGLVSVYVFCVVMLALFGTWIARRVIPPFELVKIGGKARGIGLIGAVAGGLGAFAIGVLVNLVS